MSGRFRYRLPFGAEVGDDGAVRFRLWAPSQKTVAVVLDEPQKETALGMTALDDGWFELTTEQAHDGTRYRYQLADGFRVPDPASRFQPNDVHEPSQVIDASRYLWRHATWSGLPWEETVLYEIHLGCFTRQGGFDGTRYRLDHIARTGVTALELMPIADFEGRRNWGYDGVLPFAPDSSYGAPDQLKQLIDEAHERGLMVFLDVVYNHFGPSGNYLRHYAPSFFTDRYRTPWGEAIDFDGPESRPVRDFFIHNALYWLLEYRFDGLRLDAVHAIRDARRPDILEELATEVHRRIEPGRHVHLVLENDNNAARYLERDDIGRPRYYTAQWNDDFHHAAHVLLTSEGGGYYGDYIENPAAAFARALAEGFAYQGERSSFRQGTPRGEPSAHLPPTAFVAFLQNHDQIGNRAFGERLTALAEETPRRALMAILLLSPQIPMVFMGEEWGASNPFLYFCDYTGELAQAVRAGRCREFARFPAFRDTAAQARIPDPNALEPFVESQLDWMEPGRIGHGEYLDFVRQLIRLRHYTIIPQLAGISGGIGTYESAGERALKVRWKVGGGARLYLVANLSPYPATELDWVLHGRRLFTLPENLSIEPRVTSLPPWSVCFTLEFGMSAA